MGVVQVKVPRRLESQNSPVLYLPVVTAPVLPFLLTVLTVLPLLLLFTIEESTLNFLLITVSTVMEVPPLPRLYRVFRTLLDCLSGRGVVSTPSLGTGAEVDDKSDSEGSECGNRDVLGKRSGSTGTVVLDS